jgi:hypothetical protein
MESIAEELVRQSAPEDRVQVSVSSASNAFHEVSCQDHARFSSGLPEFDLLGGGSCRVR